jgi:hypothetical protein
MLFPDRHYILEVIAKLFVDASPDQHNNHKLLIMNKNTVILSQFTLSPFILS